MKKRALVWLLAAAGLLLAAGIAAMALTWRSLTRPLEERWLAAVAHDDADTALVLAPRIAAGAPLPELPAEHVELAEREGLRKSFLRAPFNVWDYRLWQDAWFFHDLARRLAEGEPDEVVALFRAVAERVEKRAGDAADIPWPREVWERGRGLCDRQAWLLAELAWQRGFETQVVYLRDPERDMESPHTVCEIRRGKEVWFADPFHGALRPGKSVEAVAMDAELPKKIWPDHPRFWRSMQACVLWTPAYAQDYCPRNQRLARRLRAVLKDRCPRFGEPPAARLARYKELRGTPSAGAPEFPMELWFYPLRLLRAEMGR